MNYTVQDILAREREREREREKTNRNYSVADPDQPTIPLAKLAKVASRMRLAEYVT
jgi:hypothetical protein